MKKLFRYLIYSTMALVGLTILMAGAAYIYESTLSPEERAELEKSRAKERVEQAKTYKHEAKSKAEADLASHDTEAYVIAKEFVKTRLKYPEEADFPFTPTSSKHVGSGAYNVLGEVTAKNAFGVKSRYVWRALIKFNGGDDLNPKDWEVVALELKE